MGEEANGKADQQAGAAALASSSASAQVVVVPVDETVGFAIGDLSSFTSALPGASQFRFKAYSFSNGFYRGVPIKPAAGTFTMKVLLPYFNSPVGKKFSTLSGTTAHSVALVGSVDCFFTGHNIEGPFPSYLNFRFKPLAAVSFDYGYIELGGYTVGGGNPSITIDDYAYELSGPQLPNGATSSVPEPSAAVVLAAFSALTLRAAGVRRLKAMQAA